MTPHTTDTQTHTETRKHLHITRFAHASGHAGITWLRPSHASTSCITETQFSKKACALTRSERPKGTTFGKRSRGTRAFAALCKAVAFCLFCFVELCVLHHSLPWVCSTACPSSRQRKIARPFVMQSRAATQRYFMLVAAVVCFRACARCCFTQTVSPRLFHPDWLVTLSLLFHFLASCCRVCSFSWALTVHHIQSTAKKLVMAAQRA